jgi:hypothetical protein
MRISKIDAILSLSPGAEVVVRGEEVEWINPSVAPVTEAQIATELAKLQADYEAKQYQRNRAGEYPAIGDQLDALFHAGVFPEEMAEKIQAIKNKYPKS